MSQTRERSAPCPGAAVGVAADVLQLGLAATGVGKLAELMHNFDGTPLARAIFTSSSTCLSKYLISTV